MRYILQILIVLLLGLTNDIQLAETTHYSVDNQISKTQFYFAEVDVQPNVLFDDAGIDFSGSGEAILTKHFHPGFTGSSRLNLRNVEPVRHTVSLHAFLIDLPPPCLM